MVTSYGLNGNLEHSKMNSTNEKFFRDIAKRNHRFLKSRPLSFKSDNLRSRQISWLLYIGLLETWTVIAHD